MIVASVPLRISLVGGSTDQPAFLAKYGTGEVISFPCDLRVYASVHRDVLGTNGKRNKWIINYSKREEVSDVVNIHNDVVRETLLCFDVEPCTISLTSDVPSYGSGLACSSAYIMALVAALNPHLNEEVICSVAYEIERRINPSVGLQDFYGSTKGGLRRLTFSSMKDDTPACTQVLGYNDSIFDTMKESNIYMMLVPTGISRSSTEVLKTLDVDACRVLLDDVQHMHYILTGTLATGVSRLDEVATLLTTTWEHKKNTSTMITQNPAIKDLDDALGSNPLVKGRKLCGAGNGGYFFVLLHAPSDAQRLGFSAKYGAVPIKCDHTGIIIK